MANVVVLVPGLGLGGIEMWPLRRALSRRGYDTRIFYFWPWRDDLDTYAARLNAFIAASGSEPVDVVAHSLGGVVSARAATLSSPCRVRRLVTLGSPHRGCAVAVRLWRLPGMRALLGRTLADAVSRLPVAVPAALDLGSVAGSMSLGLGMVLGVPRPNDSIIGVDEAHHPQATDTLTVPASHAGMLLSRRLVARIVAFLNTGRFAAD